MGHPGSNKRDYATSVFEVMTPNQATFYLLQFMFNLLFDNKLYYNMIIVCNNYPQTKLKSPYLTAIFAQDPKEDFFGVLRTLSLSFIIYINKQTTQTLINNENNYHLRSCCTYWILPCSKYPTFKLHLICSHRF
jgi:hypothetical protein